MIAFTICSNNYLGQASVLMRSLKKFHSDFQFFTILVDEYNVTIDYSQLPFTCIAIKEIEPGIDDLVEKYDIVELNTCVKPKIFQYFFTNYTDDQVIYFDPDIKIFDTLNEFKFLFSTYDILLTPHIFTPIEYDGKKPDENLFLNYGIYNLGFIAVQKSEESSKFIDWWKERTYRNGYNKVSKGIFVDQLYINFVPVFFKKVFILTDRGYNMAPWNLHERYLTKTNEVYLVNSKETLKFFHFSSFRIDSGELPLHLYNRFLMSDREDLVNLYSDYNIELSAAGYSFFKTIKCVYLNQYHYKQKQLKQLQEKEFWEKKSFLKKLILKAVKRSPALLQEKVRETLIQLNSF